ncbi:hypothetical protein BCV72DRAFT_208962 [Rhizopus microsporus var. microsporus]|uniref:Uncharacterized protein n=1 Tax=Rhizopus microsporus var. microsporus TaxID=86635 RepID=A0A1X0R102_RHIZD|nr:hypothetical protein BCV72DRAFT_208962 [Rhizopus microsporus var. microsporus]
MLKRESTLFRLFYIFSNKKRGSKSLYHILCPPFVNCSIAEICKRQLHLRMKVARSIKEFATFGIIVAGRRYILFTSCNFF